MTYVSSSSIGPYLESGTAGHADPPAGYTDGDWFAYTLSGLTVGQPYEVQIDYPDNAQRTFDISVEQGPTNPTDSGVVCGGPYTLSDEIQTTSIIFYATISSPRLLFLNWQTGQQAAVQEIRVYSINTPAGYTTPFPALNGTNPNNRTNSLYFEQFAMIPGYMGGSSAIDDWNEWLTSVDRLAQWSRYEGINQWIESVDSYGNDMAPMGTSASAVADEYGYAPADEDSSNGLYDFGAFSSKDVFQKDLIRLELLVVQQYGISYIPELQPGIDGDSAQQIDLSFGGDGNPGNLLLASGEDKPWVTVSNTGSYSTTGPGPDTTYYNVFDPQVQAWVTQLVLQLAERYADSPALAGVAIRLMGWQFSGMFSVASLNWGYEDYTIDAFCAANPGLSMPNYTDSNRFAERYAWLTNPANTYDGTTAEQIWINWRDAQVTAFYQSLTTALQAILRPNGGGTVETVYRRLRIRLRLDRHRLRRLHLHLYQPIRRRGLFPNRAAVGDQPPGADPDQRP